MFLIFTTYLIDLFFYIEKKYDLLLITNFINTFMNLILNDVIEEEISKYKLKDPIIKRKISLTYLILLIIFILTLFTLI